VDAYVKDCLPGGKRASKKKGPVTSQSGAASSAEGAKKKAKLN